MKKNIASAILLGAIITTGSVFAQTPDVIVPTTTSEVGIEATSTPLREGRPEGEDRRAVLRERAERQKEEMEGKRESIKQEVETRRAEAKAKLEERKAEFEKRKETLKTEMENRLEEAKKAREERRVEMEAVKKESVEKRKEFVQKGLLEVLSVLESRAARVETMIAQAGSRGIVTTEAMTFLTEAKSHITEAKTALTALNTTAVTTTDTKTVSAARTNAQAVHTHFKAARESLVKSTQALKKAIEAAKAATAPVAPTTNTTTE